MDQCVQQSNQMHASCPHTASSAPAITGSVSSEGSLCLEEHEALVAAAEEDLVVRIAILCAWSDGCDRPAVDAVRSRLHLFSCCVHPPSGLAAGHRHSCRPSPNFILHCCFHASHTGVEAGHRHSGLLIPSSTLVAPPLLRA